VKHLRQNYTLGSLLEKDLPQEPFSLFEKWFEDAENESGILEPNAMVLSTVDNGIADSRIVLLKDLRDQEFVFYTNYTSKKGSQIAQNPNCSLLFPWINLQRQIIVRGTVKKVSETESDEYFFSRPKSSQVGAWVSDQSSQIESRAELDNKLALFSQRFEKEEIKRPIHWGGYAVEPIEIEFWQGRENRLHDRISFRKEGADWQINRLQP
jgi:pyridoxamine 5'-phosphate oxidase